MSELVTSNPTGNLHDILTARTMAEALAACITALAQQERLVRPLIAAAGGIRADNAAAYVAAGADLLVTSAPYAAPAKDVQVHFRSTT